MKDTCHLIFFFNIFNQFFKVVIIENVILKENNVVGKILRLLKDLKVPKVINLKTYMKERKKKYIDPDGLVSSVLDYQSGS